MRLAVFVLALCGCASSRTLAAYESDQWAAARAACGYASPCSAPDEATAAVRIVREQLRGRCADPRVDARVDAWIETQRRTQ